MRKLVLASLVLSFKAYAIPVSIVSHHWITKITDSRNNVTIRPGSVYEIQTYFEEILRGFRPKFKYIFRDTGLGTADPIYPIFQQGYQKSWLQLLPAMFSKKNRHIDHYSKVEVPEGCTVYSAYWVRHIDEFPDLYHEERAAGYVLVDTGFDYYEKKSPGITHCGRHKAHDPVPKKENPVYRLKKFAKKYRTYDDIPEDILSQVETKIGLLKLVKEEFSRKKWPRYDDVYELDKNSMWFYPDGVDKNYGLNQQYFPAGLQYATQAGDYIIESNSSLRSLLTGENLIRPDEWESLMETYRGVPSDVYSKDVEPGGDHFELSQVRPDFHIYTHGLDLWKIEDVYEAVENPENYKLVGVVVRPFEAEADQDFNEPQIIPQVRFVLQLKDPIKNEMTEQVYLHLQYDGVNRYADRAQREVEHQQFLSSYDELIRIKKERPYEFEAALLEWVSHYTHRPMQTLAFSSSLTGIWVFGSLTRSFNEKRELKAVRIQRQGIDAGYYSSIWDSELFRTRLAETQDEQEKARLKAHLEALSPTTYRDPKRHNVHSITFNQMTCAQCHQMSARDGVHFSLNDGIDPRSTSQTKKTQFLLKELERQLQFGENYFEQN